MRDANLVIIRLKQKIGILIPDSHMREVVRGLLLAMLLKVSGSGLAFVFNIIVARILGAEGAGLYFLALAIATIGSVIGRVGLDNSLLRFVATNAAHGEWGTVKGVYALGMRMTIIASAIVTIIIFLAAPWMAITLFGKEALSEPLRWMSLSILPFAMLNLAAECLKGVKHIRDAMIVQSIGIPLFSLLFIIPLAQAFGVVGAGLAYFAGTVTVTVLGLWAWKKTIAKHSAATKPFPFWDLWKSCQPLFVVSLMINAVRPWAPLFLLGIWATTEEVGIFGVASRLVTLTTMMLFTSNNVLAPKLTELYAKGEMNALASTARRSSLLLVLLSSPLFLALIFGGHWVMGLYGKSFEQGALVLAILASGQIANVFTGSLGVILIVSGQERYTQNMTVISTVALFIMSFVLIPVMGSVGSALAVAISGTGLSLASAWYVQHVLGIKAIPLLNKV